MALVLRMLGPVVLILALAVSRAEYDIDDSTLYKIEWPGPLLPSSGLNTAGSPPSEHSAEAPPLGDTGLWSGEGEQVVMTSVDNERFSCRLPKVDPRSSDSETEYSGPTVLGLLEKLFTQQSCAYRIESYWTYELCHGRFLRQYHEERDGKEIKLQQYSLGKFTKEMFDQLVVDAEKDLAGGITRHPPTKKIEGMNMPYHEVVMTDGDLCDLNKQPRRTRVLYVCYPAGKNEVYSLKEVSTCEYEVVVLTAMLCSHPSYKPEESQEHGISCRPIGEGAQKRKPARLSQLEIDGLKLRSERMFENIEAHLSGGDGPGQVRIEIKPVKVDIDGDEVPEQEPRPGQWKESVREPIKPLMDPQVVKEFLRGEYCLYGGSGWWKYEFCYGKKVDQYHEEGGGKKTVVRLGEFKEEEHLRWLEEHPGKRPKPRENRKQVSIFYSGGDICDLTGSPRQIEVKMKCKPADSPSTVSLYLLEPKTCEYVLGVESPLVCDILPHADDETGLFPSGLVDRVGDMARDAGPVFSQSDREKLEILKKKIVEGRLMEGEAFANAGEAVVDGESKITKQSVHISGGVKTIVKKTIVNGVVVSSTKETIRDGQKTRKGSVDVDAMDPDEEDDGETSDEIDGMEEDDDDYEDDLEFIDSNLTPDTEKEDNVEENDSLGYDAEVVGVLVSDPLVPVVPDGDGYEDTGSAEKEGETRDEL